MLQVIIDGKQAVLPEGSEIEIRLNNFVLEEREDSTYPLTLPLKANRHIFGFPERINNNIFRKEYPAVLYYGPWLLLAGRTVITDISGDEIELFIATDNKSFWGTQADRYIDQLELGEERYSSADELYEALSMSVRGIKKYVCTQLWDPDYNFSGYIPHYYNRWDLKTQKLMKMWGVHKNTYCPFPRLLNVIEWVIKGMGYHIRVNDLEKIAGFSDILVVHRRSISMSAPVIHYNRIVPHITIRQFFEELERKFSIRFFVYEGSKEVFIRSAAVIRTASSAELSVYDDIHKSFEEEDQKEEKKNYKFFDKEVADPYLDSYKEKLVYIDGENENLTEVKCISTIVGVHMMSDIIENSGNTNNSDDLNRLTVMSEVLSIQSEEGYTEFRLTVYRGLLNRAIRGPESEQLFFGIVPVATPTPVDDSANKISLLWTGADGLFATFQQNRVSGMRGFNQVHELTVVPDAEIISKAQDLFSQNVMIRGQRYILKEQNIRFSSSGISEHTFTAYPL